MAGPCVHLFTLNGHRRLSPLGIVNDTALNTGFPTLNSFGYKSRKSRSESVRSCGILFNFVARGGNHRTFPPVLLKVLVLNTLYSKADLKLLTH